jgi:hypothetical protein
MPTRSKKRADRRQAAKAEERMAVAAARVTRKRKSGDLEQRFVQLSREHAGLLDILNAILMANGGRVIVPQVHVQAATRKRIVVDPPAPGREYWVIAQEGQQASETPSDRSVAASRLAALGMEVI